MDLQVAIPNFSEFASSGGIIAARTSLYISHKFPMTLGLGFVADINQMSSIEKARAYDNKGFQWTRRIIALIAVFFIIVWPKLVPVIFDVSVFLTWTELSRGFLFLIEQKEMLVDREIAGVVITPMDTHLMSAIVGLYFGGSLVKK